MRAGCAGAGQCSRRTRPASGCGSSAPFGTPGRALLSDHISISDNHDANHNISPISLSLYIYIYVYVYMCIVLSAAASWVPLSGTTCLKLLV